MPKSQYFALKSYALHHETTVSQLVRDSLRGIVEYDTWFKAKVQAAQADPRPAIDLWLSIDVQVSKLTDPSFPRRRGRVPGTLELVVHPNYVVILEQTLDTATVLEVLHSAMKYP